MQKKSVRKVDQIPRYNQHPLLALTHSLGQVERKLNSFLAIIFSSKEEKYSIFSVRKHLIKQRCSILASTECKLYSVYMQ